MITHCTTLECYLRTCREHGAVVHTMRFNHNGTISVYPQDRGGVRLDFVVNGNVLSAREVEVCNEA